MLYHSDFAVYMIRFQNIISLILFLYLILPKMAAFKISEPFTFQSAEKNGSGDVDLWGATFSFPSGFQFNDELDFLDEFPQVKDCVMDSLKDGFERTHADQFDIEDEYHELAELKKDKRLGADAWLKVYGEVVDDDRWEINVTIFFNHQPDETTLLTVTKPMTEKRLRELCGNELAESILADNPTLKGLTEHYTVKQKK